MALILSYRGIYPQIDETAFVAANATIIGNVIVNAHASIWYGAVLRGDSGQIIIGANSNVQDNAVLHCNELHDTLIGPGVTIGHAAVLEGCVVAENVLIGMNATVLSGAMIGAGALIAAGAVVRENFEVPAAHLAAGVPARVRGPLSLEQQQRLQLAPQQYVYYAQQHRLTAFRALQEHHE